MRFIILFAGLALIYPGIGQAGSVDAHGMCSGIDVDVTAPDQAIVDLVCDVAVDQAGRLAECGIRQTRPVSVAIVPGIEGLPENCVGAFHCETDEVEVVLPQTLAERDAPGFIYRGLGPEAAFASILRHELTHAFLEHTTEDSPIDPAAHEYIAFALQIDAMTDEERARFLAVNGDKPVTSLETLNMFIYGFVPGRFGTAAWLHFSAPENGCAFIEDVISGEVLIGVPDLSPPSGALGPGLIAVDRFAGRSGRSIGRTPWMPNVWPTSRSLSSQSLWITAGSNSMTAKHGAKDIKHLRKRLRSIRVATGELLKL